jgi:hypothetical protein
MVFDKIKTKRCHQKKVLALVLAFACAFTMFAGAAFTDQADIAASNEEAVNTLVALGIINGYKDGSFKPNDTVTRAEMAKMIYTIRSGGNTDASSYKSISTTFKDVNGHWAAGYIKYCQTMGIIAGKNATTFDPDGKVTVAETAKMALVTMGYKADKAKLTGSGWMTNTINLANDNDLLEDVKGSVATAASRQEAAQILYNMIDAECVLWSNDKEQFVVDGKDDTTKNGITAGEKYLDLIKAEDAGILTAVTKEDGRDTYTITTTDVEEGDEPGTWDRVEGNFYDLIGQRVTVLYKNNKDKTVYGVYADEDSKVLATGTVGELSAVDNGTAKKTKLAGTEYKLETIGTNDKYTEAVSSAVTPIVPNATNNIKLNTIEDYNNVAQVAGTVKLIDNNGNGKADSVVYIPAVAGKLTYVGSKSLTIEGVGSKDIDDLDIYDGYAKDDWVAFVDDDNTASGDFEVTKLTMTTAKVTSTKGTGANLEVRVDGVWYKTADDGTDETTSMEAGNTYDLVIAGNHVVNAKETEEDSASVLFVADYAGNNDGFTAASKSQDLLVYFMDGSSEEITVKKAQLGTETSLTDITKTHKFGNDDVNKLYTYSKRSNGEYQLKLLDQTNNKAGYETIGEGTIAAKQKIDGKSIADDAVIFVAYTNVDDTSAKDDIKVISGKTVNNWSDSTTYGDSGVYATKKSNGIEYVKVAAIVAANKYSGAGSDYLYAYMTGNSYTDTDGEDNDKVTAYPVWNGTEETVLYYDGEDGEAKSEGDILIYTEDGKFIDIPSSAQLSSENVVLTQAAITGLQKKAEGDIVFITKAGTETSVYSLHEDCVFIKVDDDEQVGMEGASLENISNAEDEVDASGVKTGKKYLNAHLVYDTAEKKVLAIIYDGDNNHLDGDWVVEKGSAATQHT